LGAALGMVTISKDGKPDPSDTEELHVLVTGDND
jgi:hypothetical protein